MSRPDNNAETQQGLKYLYSRLAYIDHDEVPVSREGMKAQTPEILLQLCNPFTVKPAAFSHIVLISQRC
ncbi:hypothetical protein D3C85_1832010 [compost metagenome]